MSRSLMLLTGQYAGGPEGAASAPDAAYEGARYAMDAELFICPSSRYDYKSPIGYLKYEHCSYAYALNLGTRKPSVPPKITGTLPPGEYALMADKKSTGDDAGGGTANRESYGYGGGSPTQLTGMMSHGRVGINVLYVNGHVRWVASNRASTGYRYIAREAIPNCIYINLPYPNSPYYHTIPGSVGTPADREIFLRGPNVESVL